MAKDRQPTSDAVAILQRRYFEGKPEMLAALEQARLDARIAQQIYELRTTDGLTQRELAERVGTTASVICRLEDADYRGHSLSILQRIAVALWRQVEVRLVPSRSGADRRMSKSKRRGAMAKRKKAKLAT